MPKGKRDPSIGSSPRIEAKRGTERRESRIPKRKIGVKRKNTSIGQNLRRGVLGEGSENGGRGIGRRETARTEIKMQGGGPPRERTHFHTTFRPEKKAEKNQLSRRAATFLQREQRLRGGKRKNK